ncbi:MAG TPA: FecR domain-containing protein [Chitinophagaceae bacterium]|nr:FecR domain-containing protein [Chitinophagaceae bacterium]
MSRKLSGEATTAELEELEELLKSNSKAQYSYEVLSEWWEHEDMEMEEQKSEDSLKRVKEQLSYAETKEENTENLPQIEIKPWYRRWGVAAAIIILLGLSAVYLYPYSFGGNSNFGSTDKGIMSQVSTRYGSKSKIVLPDGTLVRLNAGSNITYNNKEFGKSTRTVTLVGEAYFDVAEDANHPFVIHAGEINIKVLGTVFNVKSYPDDSKSSATLISGSIEVSFANRPQKKVRLQPHQTLTLLNHSISVEKDINSTPNGIHSKKGFMIAPAKLMPEDSLIVATSWVEDKLAFRSETFPELARQMERWYNIHINFSDDKVKKYQFTGIFKNESLKQALKALKITAPFHYDIIGDEVYIYSDN